MATRVKTRTSPQAGYTLILRNTKTIPYSLDASKAQFLFRNTLFSTAGAEALGAVAFLVAPPIPLIVLITVLLGGAFLAAAGFVTTVVDVLTSLDWLPLLTLPLPARDAAGAGATRLLLPVPVVVGATVEAITLREVLARVAFAFSNTFVKVPAAPPAGAGTPGFSGDIGRAR